MIRIAILATRLLLCSASAAVAQPALPGTNPGGEAGVPLLSPGAIQAGRAAMLQGGQEAGPEVGYLAPVPPGERDRSALLMRSVDGATIAYRGGLADARG